MKMKMRIRWRRIKRKEGKRGNQNRKRKTGRPEFKLSVIQFRISRCVLEHSFICARSPLPVRMSYVFADCVLAVHQSKVNFDCHSFTCTTGFFLVGQKMSFIPGFNSCATDGQTKNSYRNECKAKRTNISPYHYFFFFSHPNSYATSFCFVLFAPTPYTIHHALLHNGLNDYGIDAWSNGPFARSLAPHTH